MKKDKLATHWVLATGADCDGYSSGRVYAFDNEDDANKFSDYENEWSDGQRFPVTDNIDIVVAYCYDYGMDLDFYKTISI